MKLSNRARSIFEDLGYTVEGGGAEFRAQRAWKSVTVSTVSDPSETPTSGSLRCFVTDEDTASDLERYLSQRDPEYDWAIISVSDGEGYEVVRAPPACH
jgi:hypothetical protein